jgi:hypothetical protein
VFLWICLSFPFLEEGEKNRSPKLPMLYTSLPRGCFLSRYQAQQVTGFFAHLVWWHFVLCEWLFKMHRNTEQRWSPEVGNGPFSSPTPQGRLGSGEELITLKVKSPNKC